MYSQLLLEAAKCAYFVHERKVAAEVPHEQLCSLASNSSCMAAR